MGNIPAAILVILLNTATSTCDPALEIVSRQDWGARPPKDRETTSAATLVVIHHTYIPAACSTREECIQAMRGMQDMHMDINGWSDIGYNFAVGVDAVYEGRGWEVVGAHAKGYNDHSLGIAFIGDYRDNLPSTNMLNMAQALIRDGLQLGFVEGDYQLVGHRQVRATECPGGALFQEIMTWPHWVPTKSGVARFSISHWLLLAHVIAAVFIAQSTKQM